MKTSTERNRGEIVNILNSALARLRRQNDLTSLRSIALALKLSPSYLSKVFRGDRRLPPKLVGPLGKVLRLDHHETKKLQHIILAELESRKMTASTGVHTVKDLDSDSITAEYAALGAEGFWLLEEWYHLPLLNLITTENFDPKIECIATRLGISAERAERSLARLLHENYARCSPNGQWERTHLKIRFPTQRSHPRIRAFHRMNIEKSLKILDNIPSEFDFNERLISGMSFAANPAKLTEAKLLIEEAMFKAANLLSQGNCTEVFQLNLQLFKLTR